MMVHRPFIVTLLLSAALAAQAAERFVSADGTWVLSGHSGTCYADDKANNKSALQKAIDASAAGDTVWVKNSYVCDFGFYVSSQRAALSTNRIFMSKNVYVRGEDDDWTNGPIIRGAHDDSTSTGYGGKSVRCVYFDSRGGKLIGFQLLDGSCPVVNGDGNNGGGAVMMNGTPAGNGIYHCLVANAIGSRGAGVYGGYVSDSVISNCWSFTGGGGGCFRVARLVNSTVCNCTANGGGYPAGGGVSQSAGHVVSNCIIRANTSSSDGGGISGGTAIDCIVTGNTGNWGGGLASVNFIGTRPYSAVLSCNRAVRGGGATSGTYTNCFIHSNEATGGDGGGVYVFQGNGAITLDNCIISNNVAKDNGGGAFRALRALNCLIVTNRSGSSAGGGGLFSGAASGGCTAIGCRFLYNVTEKNGGAVNTVTCRDCDFIGNVANGQNGGYGGGAAYGSNLTDCRVIGNRVGGSKFGGGIYGGSATRTVFCDNDSPGTSGGGGAAAVATLVQCAITNNSSGRYGGAAFNCTTKNCIFYRNLQRESGAIGAGGGAVNQGTHYNDLYLENTAYNNGGAAWIGTYYNCTACSNTTFKCRGQWSFGGGFCGYDGGCLLVNCISFGNLGDGDSMITLATNSCVQISDISEAKYVNCVHVNPLFVNPAKGDCSPRNLACRDTAVAFDWMRDTGDVRSRDVSGAFRIDGKGPDMGACELTNRGLVFILDGSATRSTDR